MLRSLNTSATGMVAQQLNLDVISNNLANANTTGFKHQRAEFQDLIYQTVQAGGTSIGNNQKTPGGVQYGLGATNSATANDFAQGAALNTNNSTDVMVVGEGFFQVLKPDGTFAYTRDGSFKRDATGTLVTSSGYKLQPEIVVPANTVSVSIGKAGNVEATTSDSSTPVSIGQITLAVFPNPAGLSRIGGNMWAESTASGTATIVPPETAGAGGLMAGYLEGSNVSVVEEMVRMISAQRAYEINSKAIQTSDDMLQTLNTLKR
ncbi:MAG: flagellar basal-body rod protein FlgG [Armatimonadota bacterium]